MLHYRLQHRIELEQAILGACLVERSAFPLIADFLSPVNFSLPDTEKALLFDHREIFKAFEKLYPTHPIDLVTASGALPGYRDYLNGIASRVTSAASIRSHAATLVEYSIRETFIETLNNLTETDNMVRVGINEIIDEALDYDNDIFEVVSTAAVYMSRLGSETAHNAIKDFQHKIDKRMATIKRMASIDALINNLTALTLTSNEPIAKMAVSHLAELIKTILSKQKITNETLTKILGITV